jgi:Ca2+-transporting ATPase
MGSNTDTGLPTTEATSRRTTYGPNEITAEEPPSTWAIALGQF